jgi:ABC-type multidrug transport system ATPase subunit
LNGIPSDDPATYWSSLVAFIDQIDRLHPYLTVKETLDFAWQCRSGGTHAKPYYDMDDADVKEAVEKMDKDDWLVNAVMEGFGLARVKDTFVGDNTSVRGVSGGEKKRVTVAEMFCVETPVMCCDEISTGLDAATTYDIVKLMSIVGKVNGKIRLVSLLQPPPETVALFDELILVDHGRVIYSGPLDGFVPYFESLGYFLPDNMDGADWLQSLPTHEGRSYLKDKNAKHLTSEEFKEKFDATQQAKQVRRELEETVPEENGVPLRDIASSHFQNSWRRSMKLLIDREILLWWRDKYQIKARIMQDLIMGIICGTVFWQQGDNPQSIMGLLFQNLFFVAMGSMIKVPAQFGTRSIYYKQQDGNFFPTWSYLVGRSIAGIPTAITDMVLFGTIIYWFVGLAFNDGASIGNFFIFLLLVFVTSLSTGLVFSIFSSLVKDKPTSQACMTVTIVILVLFSGFTVQPNLIPNYWIWVYWINIFAWLLRSLVVNEFQSGKWSELISSGYTEGDEILIRFGFTDRDGEPYEFVWVWYGMIFALGLACIAVFLSTYFLANLRYETGKPIGFAKDDEDNDVDVSDVVLPFQKVNLTFKDMHYTVTASTSNEKLELLKGIDGFIEAGKMTALMGSSGAGKTTLMDVLALRKSSGEISGEVRLNGHPQESHSFRRCTGYVEQFDEQQPELTVRETVTFSATMRLERSDPAVTPASTKDFINQTLRMLELTDIEDLQVGTDLTGGLSFEQKKRLSIAVELVSNPSIIFLDEPTSGLDSRSASIVMRGLKRIADTGRAVCATIHQPSIAIFDSFDSLLLLKRGGEVVFFGELGENSVNLITYLEKYEATTKIKAHENPATWMLTTIGAGSNTTGFAFDYAGAYAESTLKSDNLALIEKFCATKSDDRLIVFPNKYATDYRTQILEVTRRTVILYWRSPNYNLVRLLVSAIIALLFGSVYASQRVPTDEGSMNSRVTSIYITFLFLGVNATNTVLNVYEVARNMFYRHEAALMYNSGAAIFAFTWAETPFILLGAMIFVVPFYFLCGFALDAGKFFWYYFFMALTIGLFTFNGQMMMSLFRDSVTAQGFSGVVIGLTALFTGIIIRPHDIPTFWIFMYWLMPGHYILEGLLTTQFNNDDTPIEASIGSPFWEYLGCTEEPCYGTAQQWIFVSFGGAFVFENVKWNVTYLVGAIILVRLIAYIALTRLNYLEK